MNEITNQEDFAGNTNNNLANIYFEHAGAMMLLLDKDGYVININQKGCEVLECNNKEEITGKNWIENFIPGDLRTKTTEILKTIFQKGIDNYRTTEHEILNCKGEKIVVRWHNELLKEYGLILSSGEDITSKKEKQKIQKELASIRESSDDAIVSLSANGIILTWNKGAEKIYQYKPEEIIGMKAYPLLPEPQKDEVNRYMQRVLKGEHISHFETKRLKKDGTQIDISLSATPLIDSKGKITGAITIGRDITEKKKKERRLRENEEKYRTIFEQSGDGIFLMKESILDCNEKACQIFGFDKKELIGQNPQDLSPEKQPDGRYSSEKGKEFIRDALNGGFPRFYWKHKTKNGSLIDAEITLNLINTAEGRQLIATIHDITEQTKFQHALQEKNQEIEAQNEEYLALNEELNEVNQLLEEKNEELTASEEKFRTLFDTTADAIFIHTFDGRILEANDVACERMGYTREELMEMTPVDLDVPHRKYDYEQIIEALKQKGQMYIERVHKTKHGLEIPVELNSKVITFNNQKVVLTVARDITERKLAEQELIKAKEKAEESDRLKTAFLANMSHEIRTPMNAIVGFSQFLRDPDLDEEKKNEYLDIINSRSEHLLQIINDIIDLSKIEANQFSIDKTEISIGSMLEDLYFYYSQALPQNEKQNINLDYSNKLPRENDIIYSDDIRLKQALSNLLNNAVKFTKEGHIYYGCKLLDDNKLLFFVEDTGIGISEEAKSLVFERFRQANETINRNYGGTGLGLSISKKLVENLGGEIWMESQSGKGSKFYFTIPYEPAEIKEIQFTEKKNPQYNWKDNTILIVEDEPSSQLFLEEIILPTNAKILKAKNGREALKALNNGKKISLVLMDIQLPDINGHELTKYFKEAVPEVPVIAQTAYAMGEDKTKAFKVGCDDYISKPVNASKLLNKINSFLK